MHSNVTQQQRYHAISKKKAIDSSLEELKKKFTQQNPQYAAQLKAKQEQEQLQLQKQQQSIQLHQEATQPILQSKLSPIIADNAQYLFQQVTNLYVGNLSPDVTEEMLLKIFSKYGEIESVKVMWPRTEEEKKRKRNCGFVKFYKYESAYIAKEALNEKPILGMSMKINWGKGISSVLKSQGLLQDYTGVSNDPDLEMSYVESQLNLVIMNQQILEDEEILNQDLKFFDQALSRIKVKIPDDPRIRVIIDKFAKLVANYGYSLEDEARRMINSGQDLQNDVLSLLFSNQDPDLVNYYQWRAYSYSNGDSARSWSQHPFQFYQNGPVWIPPRNQSDSDRLNPARLIKEQMQKQTSLVQNALSHLVAEGGQKDVEMKEADEDDEYDRLRESQNSGMVPLTKEEKQTLIGILDGMTTKKADICEGMIVAMEYAQNSQDVADTIFKNILNDIQQKENVNLPKIYAKLYLISDILFNSSNPQITAAWSYRREFESKLAIILQSLNALWSSQIEGKLSQKQLKKQVSRILKIWKEHSIYEEKEIDGWEATLKISKDNYYAFNLKDAFFQPPNVKDKKLLEKLKQIVVPELKRYYKRLEENTGNIERECKLNGLSVRQGASKEELIIKLVALEEYKIRKILKQRLQAENRQELDESGNKDQYMTRMLADTLRKPIQVYDNTYNDGDVLNEAQRKQILDKAMQDIITENAKLRNLQPKLQQSYLQIDEGQIDGRPLHESEYQLLDIDKHQCERNKRLIEIATKQLSKGDIDIDNLSIDSDELMIIQEDNKEDEDIDGIEISDTDEILLKNTQKEEYFSAIVTAEHFKKILKYARQKRLIANNQQKRQLQKQHSASASGIDQDILIAQEYLDKYKLEFNRSYEKLDEDGEVFERVMKLKKRLEWDLAEYTQEVSRQSNQGSETELKILRRRVDMYKQLCEKIKSEGIAKKTKNIYEQSSRQQELERKRSRSRSKGRAKSHERARKESKRYSKSRSRSYDNRSDRERKHKSQPKRSFSVTSQSSSSSASFILDEEKKEEKKSIFDRITKRNPNVQQPQIQQRDIKISRFTDKPQQQQLQQSYQRQDERRQADIRIQQRDDNRQHRENDKSQGHDDRYQHYQAREQHDQPHTSHSREQYNKQHSRDTSQSHHSRDTDYRQSHRDTSRSDHHREDRSHHRDTSDHRKDDRDYHKDTSDNRREHHDNRQPYRRSEQDTNQRRSRFT